MTLAMLTDAEWSAVRVTLQVAAAAVIVCFPLAVLTALALARWTFPGKALLDAIINLPLVLPPIVTGYLLLIAFGRRGLIGGWLEEWLGIRIVFDWKGAALAAAVMGFPLFVRPIRQAFEAANPRFALAARTLGASPAGAFFTVTLPLARAGIVSGALLAFARSMGEFGATIMIAGNIPGETRTIALATYDLLQAPGHADEAGRLIVVSFVIAFGALLAGEFIERRMRRGAAPRGAS